MTRISLLRFIPGNIICKFKDFLIVLLMLRIFVWLYIH